MLMKIEGVEFEIIRSKRKTFAIQIYSNDHATIRAPLHATRSEIEQIARQKSNWIKKSIIKVNQIQNASSALPPISDDDIKKLTSAALEYIPSRVEYFASVIGIPEYGKISIRRQRTRWGSCSSSKNLNFNCLLMLMPNDIIDYVIVHELCHINEMNHSPKFWNDVAKFVPNYKEKVRWMRQNGLVIMRRAFS